jgi:hypothetical protein
VWGHGLVGQGSVEGGSCQHNRPFLLRTGQGTLLCRGSLGEWVQCQRRTCTLGGSNLSGLPKPHWSIENAG